MEFNEPKGWYSSHKSLFQLTVESVSHAGPASFWLHVSTEAAGEYSTEII